MRLRWALYHARYRCLVRECDRWAVLASPVCRKHDDQWLPAMRELTEQSLTEEAQGLDWLCRDDCCTEGPTS